MDQKTTSHFLQAVQQMRQRFPIIIPVLVVGVCTLVLRMTFLDIHLSEPFFDREKSVWPLSSHLLWDFVDLYCIYPGILLGTAALCVMVYCLIWNINTPAKRAAIVIGCSFMLGPGLLVNGTMKPVFSRPRPREVVELGGTHAFRPVFGFGEKTHFNSSFPSGHAAIGFFLMAPAFVLTGHPSLRISCLMGGLLYGGFMSYSRIVQGGHFLSDVLWSLTVVYLTLWLMATLNLRKELRKQQSSPPHIHAETPAYKAAA